jgi:protocatechuate 3,4-dioxygenase beta subunit
MKGKRFSHRECIKMLIPTPHMGRRQLIAGLTAFSTTLLIRSPFALSQAKLLPTPRQTEGPFYPVEWQGDIDNDLVIVRGEAARALGQVLHLEGHVRDISGAPLANTTVEIWQCDAQGIYRHPAEGERLRTRDGGFQGRGRTVTDASGYYRFRTIKPVAYTGRTPHIHFKVRPPAQRALVTQMYVFGEKLNERDGVLNGIRDRRQRESVIVRLEPADRIEQGALVGKFDIVVG